MGRAQGQLRDRPELPDLHQGHRQRQQRRAQPALRAERQLPGAQRRERLLATRSPEATPVCPVSVGESLDTKPGNNAGPTAQGLNTRITTWQTLNQIVQFNADGTTTLLQPNSPQLIVIPVLTNPSGQSVWPNGSSSPMTVVGFAWFVITSCGDPANPSYCGNSDGKQVNGTFVNLDSSASMGTPGPYDPTSNTAFTVELTQ